MKEYEDPNMGTSALSGKIRLAGSLHLEGEGWSHSLPYTGYWDVSGDGPTGSTYFSGDESDFGMLVGMAIGHSYKVEDKIIKLLGKVDFVYQDTGPDLKGPFRLLEAALEKYGPLPTEDGGSRHVSATEFMLMQPDPVQGHYQFKHSRTRNYVFLNARRGILVVPQTDQAFKRGFF